MTENKTRPTAASVEAYLAALQPAERRADAEALCALMGRISGWPPVMWGPSMIGFGQYRYRTDAGREGDLFRVGFAPRRPAHVLYIHGGFDRFEALKAKIGKFTAGKACIYVKRLSDLDPPALEALVAASLAHMREAYPD